MRVMIYKDPYACLNQQHTKWFRHGSIILTAKLRPLATRTTELTDLLPPDQGSTHCPDAFASVQDEPFPLTGSQPAAVASDWNSVIEYPSITWTNKSCYVLFFRVNAVTNQEDRHPDGMIVSDLVISKNPQRWNVHYLHYNTLFTIMWAVLNHDFKQSTHSSNSTIPTIHRLMLER